MPTARRRTTEINESLAIVGDVKIEKDLVRKES
jgi:hypothetical protein